MTPDEGEVIIGTEYQRECTRDSDINEHLPTLCRLASGCSNVAEMGVRNVVSTWALLRGLLEAGRHSSANPKLWCVDIENPPEDTFQQLLSAASAAGIAVEFIRGNSAVLQLPADVDLLFIDTWHVYGHLKRELHAHAPRVRRFIALHDTEVDAEQGESIRMGYDVDQQVQEYGYTREEVTTGLRRAISEFLEVNQGVWAVYAHYENNNGLTVLKRLGVGTGDL